MAELPRLSGRIVKAPEGHLDPALLEAARVARRRFMGRALAFGAGAAGAGSASGQGGAATSAAAPPAHPATAVDGDPAILNLPEHTHGPGPAGGDRRLRHAVAATSATCSAARARA